MEILVTRHGQTAWNVLEKLQGQTDIALNNIGKQQAKETGELIKNQNIDLIITSPSKRANGSSVALLTITSAVGVDSSKVLLFRVRVVLVKFLKTLFEKPGYFFSAINQIAIIANSRAANIEIGLKGTK